MRRIVIAASLVLAVPAVAASAESPQGNARSKEGAESRTQQRGDAYFYLMKAGIAASSGRGPDVVAALRDATALEPESAPLHAEAAAMLQMLGRKADAERMARRALEIEPANSGAIRVLADLAAGRAFSAESDTASRDEAMRLYEQLAQDPAVDGDFYPILVRLKLQADDRAGAVEIARRFAAKRPGDEGATRLLAQSLLHDGRPGEALDTLLTYLASEPDSDDLLNFAADLARREKEWKRFEGVLGTFLEAHPGNTLARGLRGEALLRLGRPVEAASDLEKALDLAPGEPMIRLQLATAYGALSRFADAVAIAQGLSAQFPENGGIRAVLGEALARQGDVNGALDAFEEALRELAGQDDREEGPDQRDEIRRTIARLHMGRKQFDEATQVLAGVERPDDPESLEMLGRLSVLSGHFEVAKTSAEKLRTAGQPAVAAMIEGEAAVREKDVDRAMERFEEAILRLGGEGRARAAAALVEGGFPAQAERLLHSWVDAEPGSAEARFRLGSFLERQGKMKDAESELRESIRINPNDAEVLNYLGYSLADRSTRLDEALDLITHALRIDPWNGAYLDSLGWTYYRLGRFPEARDPLERAARDLPWDPTVLEHLGDLYDRLGERERAEATWQRALDSGADGAEALRAKIGRGRKASAVRAPDAPARAGDHAVRPPGESAAPPPP